MLFHVLVIYLAFGNCFPNNSLYQEKWVSTLIPPRYKRHQAPTNNHTGSEIIPKPVLVVAYVTPKYVTEISMKNMDFEVDMEILVEWYDNRLLLPAEEVLDDSDNTLPAEIAEKIWYPSLFLDNCKGNGHLVSTPKSGLSGLINVGKLWTEVKDENAIGMRVDYRKTFCFTCNLDFTAYPFDIQHCKIQLTWNYHRLKPVLVKLYSHDRERPNNTGIQVPPGFRMTSFTLEIKENHTSDRNFLTERRSLTFTFHRIFAQHVMLIFFPSILIVILSWLSFWLDVDSSAPRVALGLTSLLTLATQFNAAQRDLPPVAKIKALDIWMFTCMFMVFASLIEYGLANFFQKRLAKQQVRPHNNARFKHSRTLDVKTAAPTLLCRRRIYPRCCCELRPISSTSRIDYAARVFFPVSFLIFNICFWCEFYLLE